MFIIYIYIYTPLPLFSGVRRANQIKVNVNETQNDYV